jgi:glucose-6-phosphate dehydrogenase assembly protein OpcA
LPDTLENITPGESREANVSALAAELDALWRSAGKGDEGRHPVTRACALTLLVYTESDEAAREVSNLIGALTLQNPCRALIMVVRPDDSPSGLSARISAVCQLPAPGEKQVCCEHVTIEARGDAVRDLDKVVVPLMVSGLPVYLWWRAGRITEPEAFEKILRYIDRVYMDSEWFSDPEVDLPVLAKRIQKYASQLEVSDLNWARVTPWREITAQCFDSAETRSYLNQINGIRIEYSDRGTGGNSSLAQGLLFSAWLAGRLGWKPAGQGPKEKVRGAGKDASGNRSFLFKGQSGEIQVQLMPKPGGAQGLSGFLAVQLRASGKSPATFSLTCGPGGKCVVTHSEIPAHQALERTVNLEVFDEIGLLNEELKFSSHDRIYAEALAMVASMTS